MSTTDKFKKGYLPWFCMLALTMILTGFALQSVFAETLTEKQSKQKRAEEYIRVAQEQIKRGLYQSAETLLKEIRDNYAPYLTDSQIATVEALSKQTAEALEARRRIPDIIKQAEELSASGQHQQAITLLNGVLASPYLSEKERSTIQGILQNIQANLSAERARIQAVYDQAVEDYKQKNYEKAKAGFMQAAQSGIEVTGSISPMDYLKMIDQLQQTPPPAQPAAPAEPALKPEEQIEVEIMQMVPEKPAPAEPSAEEKAAVSPAPAEAPAAPLPEPNEAPKTEPAAIPPAPIEPTQTAPSATTDSYLNEVLRKQSVQIGYVTAIVQDALAKADQSLAQKDFTQARQSLRRAFAAIETNKLLLGDELYKSFQLQLAQKEEEVNRNQDAFTAAQQQQQEQQARQLAEQNRTEMEQRRAKAIADFMQRAYAFLDEQRYEEALGQLEQLLAVDPLNQNALILKKTLEDTVRWREQRAIQEESQKEELRLLLEADRRSIPYYNEITYPKNWKEIAARREAAEKEDLDPKTTAVEKQLETIVDLSSSITEETTFEEAIEILRNAVDPALRITPIWANLVDTAFVQRENPLNIPGASMQGITLKMALELVINAVNASAISEIGYMIKEGVIIIATLEYLDTNVTNRYFHKIYDISELLSPPANFDEYNSGGWGGAGDGGTGGGGTGGGGSSRSGGMRGGMGGGMGGMGGGMMGGGMMGGGMMGGGMMGGGMMGGGMGGMGGGMMGGMMMTGMSGNWRGEIRAIEIIYLLQQTVRPLSWYLEGGEGRVWQYNARKLIVYQTADVHKEVEDFLKKLKEGIGDQVAIEARFLLVDENFLEEIGFDMDIAKWKIGGQFGGGTGIIENINQDSINLARPKSTFIPSSLGDATTTGTPLRSSLDMEFSWGDTLDNLQVEFLIRATQMHRNTKSLSAPKAMVMNGESANIEVITERRIKTDASFTTETLTTLAGTDRTVAYFEHDIEDFDTGVRLNIMPTITEDKKYVLLRIITYMDMLTNLETDTAVGLMPTPEGGGEIVTEDYSLPTIQTSSIETRVSVPDRGTVLLGGLTMTGEYEIEAGVPALSKLPILGRLFSNRSTVKDKSILLILVKPTIVLREEAEQDAVASLKPF
ncbi:MAG TPA: type II and III secretion system protein [Anaerohalosphaeraceae bacterium]|nr:type II and III secretion system protein [Anaerohalosphaeraceae bacterium]